jgi:hypothetical protein
MNRLSASPRLDDWTKRLFWITLKIHIVKEASMFLGTHRPWFVLACTALLVTTLACANFRRADALEGTWTLNQSRSKFNPGPAPKSLTVIYEPVAQGLHVIAVTVATDGTTARSEYTADYDGKDYPITGVPLVEAVQLKRIDDRTSERIDKRGGKQVQSYVRQVYADGKTLIVTQKGTDAFGAPVDNVMVFDKTEKPPRQS